MIFPICNKCPDRAPKLFGHSFIFCWRCTGLIVGAILGILFKICFWNISVIYYVLLIPIFIDGVLQYYFDIMSNNKRRFITGIVGGLITAI